MPPSIRFFLSASLVLFACSAALSGDPDQTGRPDGWPAAPADSLSTPVSASVTALPRPIHTVDDKPLRIGPSLALVVGGAVLAGSAVWYFTESERIDRDLRRAGVSRTGFKVGAGVAIPVGAAMALFGGVSLVEAVRGLGETSR